ncbi:MAG: GNAT family N-acetyltransferase [Pyrinomonadaceae bacterium]
MDSSLTIRPATESDVPLVLEFIRELAVYEKLLDRVEANEARLREALFGNTPVAACVLAYQAELPVGFALYYFSYSTFAGLPGLYLEDLFVKPDFRGQGLGHALLQHLAKLAKDRGCWRIEWAVLHWNQSAIRFYEKLGAIPMNDWAVYRLSGAALSKLADEKN